MNDPRDWIEQKLAGRSYQIRRVHPLGLVVTRPDLPDARVLCVGLDNGESFAAEDVDEALEIMPDLQFVAVVPTRVEHEAYQRAEELGVCVAGFGELSSALAADSNISEHIDTQELYERTRLQRNQHVVSLRRRGHHAYEVTRQPPLPSLTIITTNVYEFTVDEFYRLLDSYGNIAPDIVVITNPNCRGLSTDSMTAAERAGVPLELFPDVLDGMGRRWT